MTIYCGSISSSEREICGAAFTTSFRITSLEFDWLHIVFVYISIRLQRGASIEAMFVVDFIVVMLEYGEITYEDLRLRSHLQL